MLHPSRKLKKKEQIENVLNSWKVVTETSSARKKATESPGTSEEGLLIVRMCYFKIEGFWWKWWWGFGGCTNFAVKKARIFIYGGNEFVVFQSWGRIWVCKLLKCLWWWYCRLARMGSTVDCWNNHIWSQNQHLGHHVVVKSKCIGDTKIIKRLYKILFSLPFNLFQEGIKYWQKSNPLQKKKKADEHPHFQLFFQMHHCFTYISRIISYVSNGVCSSDSDAANAVDGNKIFEGGDDGSVLKRNEESNGEQGDGGG